MLVCVTAVVTSAAGCTAAGNGTTRPGADPSVVGGALVHRLAGRGTRFWTRALLSGAAPLAVRRMRPRAAHTVVAPPRRVGALFFHDTGGNHFCTASVVDSPGHDVIATAAHCVHTGKGSHYQSDVVFVPAYQQGQTPYGVWQPTMIVVDRRWITSSDPAIDVAFLVLAPHDGMNIGDIMGGNRLTIGQPDPMRVRVTGYPNNMDAPITCTGRATSPTPGRQRFACGGYASGTSGSPWITDYDPLTHAGRLVGVIGGYQEGGVTSDVSYSPVFGADVEALYRRAVDDSHG